MLSFFSSPLATADNFPLFTQVVPVVRRRVYAPALVRPTSNVIQTFFDQLFNDSPLENDANLQVHHSVYNSASQQSQAPLVQVKHNSNEIELCVSSRNPNAAPLKKEDYKIELDEETGKLSVIGTHNTSEKTQHGEFKSSHKFVKTIIVPKGTTSEQIQAKWKDGKLLVKIPIATKAYDKEDVVVKISKKSQQEQEQQQQEAQQTKKDDDAPLVEEDSRK